MFCTQCGQTVDLGEEFCGNCGNPIRRRTPHGPSVSVIGAENRIQHSNVPSANALSPLALVVRFIFTLNIYWWFWLYRAYKQLRLLSATASKVTPGRAVGLCFVPIFGVYWIFHVIAELPRGIQRALNWDAHSDRLRGLALFGGIGFACVFIGQWFGVTVYLFGELLLLTYAITVQTRLDGVTVLAPRPSFRKLIGADATGLNWSRVLALTLANLASTVVFFFLFSTQQTGQSVQHPASWYAMVVVSPIALALFTAFSFRMFSSDFSAALVAACLYTAVSVINQWFRIHSDPSAQFYWDILLSSFVSSVISLSGLALSIRTIGSVFPAAVIGSLWSPALMKVFFWIRFAVSYGDWKPSPSGAMASLQDIGPAIAFATIFWIGTRITLRDQQTRSHDPHLAVISS